MIKQKLNERALVPEELDRLFLVDFTGIFFDDVSTATTSKKGNHHNGDQAALQLHTFCSICSRRSEDFDKAVRMSIAPQPTAKQCS